MNDQRKKILLGALLIVVGLVGMFLLYYFFFRAAPPPPVTEAPPEEVPERPVARPGLVPARPGVPGVPITPPVALVPGAPGVAPEALPSEAPPPIPSPVASGGLTTVATLSPHPALAPALSPNGRDLSFYSKDDGKFYQITPDGKSVPLTDQVFRDVESVAWSPVETKAILEFPDGSNILYDFERKEQVTLPKHWTAFDFAPNGGEIVFKSLDPDPEAQWLATANPDGSGATPIEFLGEAAGKVKVDWSPNQQIVATYTESRDIGRQELYFIGRNRENFKLAVIEGRQFNGQWTPEGDRLLYSTYSSSSDLKPSLWIVDAAPGATGENRQAIELETWADKCTIAKDNRTVFCAVPKELPRGAGIVRDVAKDIPDTFWRVDLDSGAKSLIAVPSGGDVTATNLKVSGDGQYLFFMDTKSGNLKKIQLR